MGKAIEAAVDDGVPFFAYLAHYAVHAPFEADPRFTANYPSLSGDNLAFATLIEGMDKSFGDLLAKLDTLGVAADTLVIFLSDNGTPIGGMRVPMLAGWGAPDPSNAFQQTLPVAPGSREDDIVACWDLFPTVAGIAGAAYSHPIDGFDLRPYFASTPGSHRPQEFLMHYPNGHSNDFFSLLRQNEWKLILNYGSDSYELYNLATDLGETTNLAASEPARLMAMARRLARRLDGMGAQYPVNTSNGSAHPPLMPALPAVDADADGIPDSTEDPNRNGLVDPGETDPENDDSDGDKANDGAEAALGLDPLDPASFFFLRATPQAGGALELTWPSQPGNRFEVCFSSDLADWASLIEADLPAADFSRITTYAPPAAAGLRGFYRVSLK
jgi:hypothetical protein